MTAATAAAPNYNRQSPIAEAMPAANEPSMSALNLAITIADDVVRTEVECYTAPEMVDGLIWNNTGKPPGDMARHPADIQQANANADRAVRYIGLRNADAFPWRFVRHPERPELVRFEDKP